METKRKIIHIDMDAFYAQVEQRDLPSLKGKPVVIASDPRVSKRGVVATASYEARKFGIHSAMPSVEALKLCPQAVFISPRMSRYQEISVKIHEIFHRFTDEIEPLSLDEAYLDVTVNKINEPSASRLAQKIQATIYDELQLTASAGVSYNKFIAKMASDYKKPAGRTVITPEKALAFIAALPIDAFYGVGHVTAEKMHTLGIHTGADLYQWSEWDLIIQFKKRGYQLYRLVRGIDDSPVRSQRTRKSFGRETTFATDVVDEVELQLALRSFSQRISKTLVDKQMSAQTIVLKIRYNDFTTQTRRLTLPMRLTESHELYFYGMQIFEEMWEQRPVRLIGLTVTGLETRQFENMKLVGL
ncbi:DNA polymerase IV [Brochothrix thermosphacta]|uniref:DNA polymerase IV n=1 Tax=Brochothrix thermosphacta TaxID=2756 RepID=A0A1D2LZI2_BROTH|nr:DNA polymerase IV [Brochothrix thermosphacta]ATF26912.1 DNA polymerase IV [Brochothrix thermosphacta]ATH86269.1 DNA polymerase IV [Brochothrix thermosphacta]MPQ27851.1 DNA polymerase IV [Brochothrix thermosphacta]ODJ67734.1 DNA polymerase IV [Brochothrix thermosphacta]ODJ69474.1 DNA polymerase IV [Brochothrix thermosphacta]